MVWSCQEQCSSRREKRLLSADKRTRLPDPEALCVSEESLNFSTVHGCRVAKSFPCEPRDLANDTLANFGSGIDNRAGHL